MAGTPGANPLHGGRTLEVGTVGFLGEPTALGLALAFGAANRLGAIDLVVGIAPVGEENGIAVQALTRAGPWRHSGAKKIQAPRQPNSVDAPGAVRSEEDGGRTKKRFVEAFRRKPTKKITRFSDRPFHTVFIPASAAGVPARIQPRTPFQVGAPGVTSKWQPEGGVDALGEPDVEELVCRTRVQGHDGGDDPTAVQLPRVFDIELAEKDPELKEAYGF